MKKYKIWCESCLDWKSEFLRDGEHVICGDCGDGLMLSVDEAITLLPRGDRLNLVKLIWK